MSIRCSRCGSPHTFFQVLELDRAGEHGRIGIAIDPGAEGRAGDEGGGENVVGDGLWDVCDVEERVVEVWMRVTLWLCHDGWENYGW